MVFAALLLFGAFSADAYAAPAAAFCEDPRGPVSSVYIPNVTKTLGGPTGWTTPFIIQNIGTASTDVEVRFLPFGAGTPVACRNVTALADGASFADLLTVV